MSNTGNFNAASLFSEERTNSYIWTFEKNVWSYGGIEHFTKDVTVHIENTQDDLGVERANICFSSLDDLTHYNQEITLSDMASDLYKNARETQREKSFAQKVKMPEGASLLDENVFKQLYATRLNGVRANQLKFFFHQQSEGPASPDKFYALDTIYSYGGYLLRGKKPLDVPDYVKNYHENMAREIK